MRAIVRHDAGDLTHRYILERRTEEPDGFGGHVTAWAGEGAIWGAPRVLRASDEVRAGQVEEELSLAVTVRFRARIAAGWRLRRGSRTFDIVTVRDPDQRRRWLVLDVRERQ